MRKLVIAMLAALSLNGCASMWHDAARDECDREANPQDRMACYDRADDTARERRD